MVHQKEIMQLVVVTHHHAPGELDLDGLSSNRISTTIGTPEQLGVQKV